MKTLLAISLSMSAFMACDEVHSQTILTKMVSKYRNSVVYLKIDKTNGSTGEVTSATATGFIVSKLGHVLTSCHAVDKKLRDPNGAVVPTTASEVTVQGSSGSKYAAMEPLSFLQCAGDPVDLALLRFKNTAVARKPIPMLTKQPNVGAPIGAMGFPFETEFFARDGTLSSLEPDDTLLVSMVLNPGDSGAPVFDNSLRVVGVAEGGVGQGTGIGVVRPIRHAAILLFMTGENIFAVNTAIPSALAEGSPDNANVFAANKKDALKAFANGDDSIPADAKKIVVTYPYSQTPAVGSAAMTNFGQGGPKIDFKMIPAAHGYKVVSAKFIVTDGSPSNVLHVAPSAHGDGVNAATEYTRANASNAPLLNGFIETIQLKVGE